MNTKVTAAMLAADVDAKIAAIAAVAAPGFSAGMSAIWRGSALPSGWLWKDGAQYSLRKKHIPWVANKHTNQKLSSGLSVFPNY